MKKVLHADMQLSTRSNECWSDHILSAMDYRLTQTYIFKQKLQNCEPIDHSRFIVDLRERVRNYDSVLYKYFVFCTCQTTSKSVWPIPEESIVSTLEQARVTL